MKKTAFFGSAMFLTVVAHACDVSFFTYANTSVEREIQSLLGSHITEEYCQKFAAKHQIVIQANGLILSRGACVGYGLASIRKKGSKTQQLEWQDAISLKLDCGGSFPTNLAVEAALKSVDSLMNSLNTYRVSN